MRRLAYVCQIVGWAVIGLALLGTAIGLVRTWSEIGAPGLSAADRQRILANGIAESFFNVVCTVPAVVILLLGRGARRRAERHARG